MADAAAGGGRALLVGGCVRDALLGLPVKDYDLEVHHLSPAALTGLLRAHGPVSEVGRSFGVLKVRLPGIPHEVDVSVPRRDSRQGTGHRGIRADADPALGVREAARRRDLTINAMAWDPLAGELVDPFGGRGDLADGLLRAVDPATFGEDPLRALRVAQFAARFNFRVDAGLEALCAAMPLEELPAERVRGEVEKLLLRAARPSVGWDVAHRTGMWARVLPAWGPLPPDLDRCAAVPGLSEGRRLALLLAAASLPAGPGGATDVLDRLRIHRVGGYPVRAQVQFLTQDRRVAHADLDTALRTWAEDGEVRLLCHLLDQPRWLERAEELGCADEALPVLLHGRDLPALGVPAGPAMGAMLRRVREAQLGGQVNNPRDARAWVRRIMEDTAGS